MTYREKIKNSTIIKELEMPNSYFGILPKKKRIKQFIVFLLMTAFTILTKFVFNKNGFDFMMIVITINLICLLYINLTGKNQKRLNHLKLYQMLFFIQKLCKVFIFATSLMIAYEFFNKYLYATTGYNFWEFNSVYGDRIAFEEAGDLNYQVFGTRDFSDILYTMGNYSNYVDANGKMYQYSDIYIKVVVLLISIVMFIPIVFYFLGTNIKILAKVLGFLIIAIIPIYNICYYLKWLTGGKTTFVNYRPKEGSDNFTICELRKYNNPKEIKQEEFSKRALISIGVLILIAVVAGGLYYLNNYYGGL